MRRFIAILAIPAVGVGVTLQFAGHHGPPPQVAAKVVVLKSEHKLLLLDAGNKVMRSYSVSLGRGGLAAKQQEGDHRTPEGIYVIDRHNRNSRFHRALHVSYPNDADRLRATNNGVAPGGEIMVHGIQNGLGWIGPLQRVMDWTSGCIALTDPEIEEIWSAVPDGTPIEIRH